MRNVLSKTPFIILSLNVGIKEREKAILQRQGFRVKALKGSYKGQTKDSYLVPIASPETIQQALHVAKQHDQESVLVCDSERRSKLIFTQDRSELDLGSFVPVTASEARSQACYTYDPEHNTYWIARKGV